MNTVTKELSWTPRRYMGADKILRFCSPACGRGCTAAEHGKAQRKAEQLAALLGSPFKPHVWENMGWFYSADIGMDHEASVHPPDHMGGYWASIMIGGRQFMGEHPTNPHIAVKLALAEARKIANDLRTLEKRLSF